MNIIFLTLIHIDDVNKGFVYTDLMRRFRDDGHQVYIVSACERRLGLITSIVENNGVKILNVKTMNIQKTNIIEKGIGTVLLENQFKKAIKKYLNGIKFDLITYSTPPITLTNVVKYLKKKSPNAISYLQLKDIFPQNAVDMGMFSNKSLFYWYFRRKEVALYKNSDFIGCMSSANVEFVIKHNSDYPQERVEVAPNSIELPNKATLSDEQKKEIKLKYGLPIDKPIFIYGGNLGKPQGIDYLISCLELNKKRTDCFFLIVGSGTDYHKIKKWYDNNNGTNVKLLEKLPMEDYDLVVRSCDVGLIFLDHRFTIPNYPSRLLSYISNKIPVLCATDVNTDIGKIAEENGYGYWCESKDPSDFTMLVDKILQSDITAMGERGFQFLKENYLVDNTYNVIMNHF